MTTRAPHVEPGRWPSIGGGTLAAGVVLATAVVAESLARRPPATLTILAVGGLCAALALGVSRYERLVGLGFLLLAVVRFEPAPTDALLGVAIGLSIVGGTLDLRRVPGWMLVLVSALLVLNLLSAIDAESVSAAERFLGITFYMLVFAVWLAAWATTPRRMRIVVRGYVAGAAITTALALIALAGVPFPGHDELIGEGSRAQGLFKDPNVFGPFLIPAALILIEEILRPRLLRLRRTTAALLLVELALGILFAYSRAGWLNLGVALVVMLGVMALRVGAGRRVAMVLGVMALVGGVAVATVAYTGSGTFLRERARVQSYDNERFEAQRTGIRLAEEHTLGVGPGQIEVVQPVSTHSIYIRVLAEQGIPGLVVLVMLLGGTLVLAVRNAIAGRDAHGVGSAALLGAWCGLLANGAFIDTLHWRHLWLVAALIWAAAAHPRPGRA